MNANIVAVEGKLYVCQVINGSLSCNDASGVSMALSVYILITGAWCLFSFLVLIGENTLKIRLAMWWDRRKNNCGCDCND